MASFISADDSLLNRYCEKDICFWGKAALITPFDRIKDTYVFDCSLHNYLAQDILENRFFLSFKSPIGIDKIVFGGRYNFRLLETTCKCDKDEIEHYISNVIDSIEKRVTTAWDQASKSLRGIKKMVLGWFIPRGGEEAEQLGYQIGVITRLRLLKDLIEMIGYRNGVLSANAMPVYVLYRLDMNKWKFSCIIGNKVVDLPAHDRLIDKQKLLQSIT